MLTDRYCVECCCAGRTSAASCGDLRPTCCRRAPWRQHYSLDVPGTRLLPGGIGSDRGVACHCRLDLSLRAACSRHQPDMVAEALRAGADVHSRDAMGRTAIHALAAAPCPPAAAPAAARILDLLLMRGAAVSSVRSALGLGWQQLVGSCPHRLTISRQRAHCTALAAARDAVACSHANQDRPDDTVRTESAEHV